MGIFTDKLISYSCCCVGEVVKNAVTEFMDSQAEERNEIVQEKNVSFGSPPDIQMYNLVGLMH